MTPPLYLPLTNIPILPVPLDLPLGLLAMKLIRRGVQPDDPSRRPSLRQLPPAPHPADIGAAPPHLQTNAVPEPSGGTQQRIKGHTRKGADLWHWLSSHWLVLGAAGLRSNSTQQTTPIPHPAPSVPDLTTEGDLELGLAGGTRQDPLTVEVTAEFLNGILQLVGGFPILVFWNHPVEALLVIMAATLVAVLWQKLFVSICQPLLQNFNSTTLPITMPSAGCITYLQQAEHKAKTWCIHLSRQLIRILGSGSWVWFLTIAIWFPAMKLMMQLRFKPTLLANVFNKSNQGVKALTMLILNRLGRQPQGRRVTHESDQLELQRFGREPLQSNSQPSRPADQHYQS